MPAVDRAILRLGAFECSSGRTTCPRSVAISEWVALATELSPTTAAFVNGLLARLAEVKPTLV
jgi:N utilization substance protein B